MSLRLRAALLPLLLPLAFTAPARTPERWAVIVGINDYLNFGQEAGGDLLGAENDARAMHEVLTRRYGFDPAHTLLLLNTAATKAAIQQALTGWIPARARAGDLVVFYFAGHGSLVADEDGDEADGIDETLCPADVLRNGSQNDIRDDELRAWLGAVPGAEVVVILDSCHSGTATRMLRGVRPRMLQREPPRGAGTRALTGGGSTDAMELGGGILEIAAAAPNQNAMDASWGEPGQEVHGGAFTTHLVRKLWSAPDSATYRELFLNTLIALKADRFAQDPQLMGPGDRALFDVSAAVAGPAPSVQPAVTAVAPAPVPAPARPAVTPVRPAAGAVPGGAAAIQAPPSTGAETSAPPALGLRVRSVSGGEVRVEGGADRALTRGSVLESAGGALITVTRVGAQETIGTLARGSVEPGERLTPLEFALPEAGLRVDATGLRSVPLRQAAAALPGVTLVSTGATDFFVATDPDGSTALLGRDGTLLRSFAPEDTTGLVSLLRHELAIRELATMDNPGAPFRVSLELVDGRRSFRPGDLIAFRIRSQRAGYLTLVDLAADGSLSVLYPNEYMPHRRLEAGETLELPGEFGEFSIEPPAGVGVVRALVTPEPLRFSARTQDAAAASAQLRDELLAFSGLRGIQPRARAAAWSSALVVYVVEQAP